MSHSVIVPLTGKTMASGKNQEVQTEETAIEEFCHRTSLHGWTFLYRCVSSITDAITHTEGQHELEEMSLSAYYSCAKLKWNLSKKFFVNGTPEHPKALNRFQRRRKRGNLEIHTAADRSRYDNGSKLGQSGQYRG